MNNTKINLLAADMGYGHQRPAHALKHLSNDQVITINNYEGIPDWEKKYWKNSLKSYETISRLKKIPLFGSLVFAIMDYFQRIKPFYPHRDLSKPTVQQKFFYSPIKKGLGKPLIEKIDKDNKPLVTTFFVVAYIAEHNNYSGDIYCVVCDTDASRAWAPFSPEKSKVKYLLPSVRLKKRFLMYGVKEENLIVTGFPLHKSLVGDSSEVIKKSLSRRLIKLDPEKKYFNTYQNLVEDVIPNLNEEDKNKPLQISFAVGGAGAQKEIGSTILKNLLPEIKKGKIFLNLIAGSRPEVRDYFVEQIKSHSLQEGEGVKVVFGETKDEYFDKFNETMKETDILWTKPSELSFFCALGLPIIIAEPVGSQEDFNKEWILSMGAGIDSLSPEYVSEWLNDVLRSGRLARAAMDGFLNAESKGVYNIEKALNLE